MDAYLLIPIQPGRRGFYRPSWWSRFPAQGLGLELCATPKVFPGVAWLSLVFSFNLASSMPGRLLDSCLRVEQAQSVRSGILSLYHTLGTVINL